MTVQKVTNNKLVQHMWISLLLKWKNRIETRRKIPKADKEPGDGLKKYCMMVWPQCFIWLESCKKPKQKESYIKSIRLEQSSEIKHFLPWNSRSISLLSCSPLNHKDGEVIKAPKTDIKTRGDYCIFYARLV